MTNLSKPSWISSQVTRVIQRVIDAQIAYDELEAQVVTTEEDLAIAQQKLEAIRDHNALALLQSQWNSQLQPEFSQA